MKGTVQRYTIWKRINQLADLKEKEPRQDKKEISVKPAGREMILVKGVVEELFRNSSFFVDITYTERYNKITKVCSN